MASASSFARRPDVYYGDGPFDPPSSDDEDDALLEKDIHQNPTRTSTEPGLVERAQSPNGLRLGGHQRSRGSRCLLVIIAGLVVFAAIVGFFTAGSYVVPIRRRTGTKHITMDHIFNGTFAVEHQYLNWVPEAGDGVFSVNTGTFIQLTDLKSNTTRNLVALKDVKNEAGNVLAFSDWKLSPDMRYILLKADRKKQWRWSSFGNYYIHDLRTNETHPLVPPSDPPVTAYAAWSTTGQSIAYVIDNDLYVLTSPSLSATPLRITNTGTPSLFNGVPDWVYEEEVFSADYALWWSLDGRKLAFLSLDESQVQEYAFPVYNPTDDGDTVVPYTSEVVMKYPKPGTPNPVVSVRVVDVGGYIDGEKEDLFGVNSTMDSVVELTWKGRHAANESIVQEVAWVDKDRLLVKEVNRNADSGHVVLFELPEGAVAAAVSSATASLPLSSSATTITGGDLPQVTGQVVRRLGRDGEEGDEGWIEPGQNIRPVPTTLFVDGAVSYLDLVPDKEGYNHLALFSPANSSTPYFLTSGEWEVTSGVLGVNVEQGLIYFTAARPSSISRHLYSIPLPSSLHSFSPSSLTAPIALTDDENLPLAWYDVDFSPQAGYYLLSYQGPAVPHQRVVSSAPDEGLEYVLTDNKALNETWNAFEAPVIGYETIESDGYELNVKEIRPPRMDDSGRIKYPVLFRVYGGPGSQLVNTKFERDWHHYAACALGYIVVVVDGRGTGFKGRALRNPVKGNLGYWETVDQVNAARIWADKQYVDSKRIGIWGWSYGGFMSSKVVEAGAGIHSLAVAVAPVTSWKLYDTIYTERYMDIPQRNEGGYVNASIADVSAFKDVDYLLMHGSADDNVHYANTAHLLDMFTKAHVRNFRFRMFTDSDHAINRRGAYRELFEYMTDFLVEKWGKGGTRRAW